MRTLTLYANRLLPAVVLLFAHASFAQTAGRPDTATTSFLGIQPDGSMLVPSNQLLRPAGRQVYLSGRPVDLALTADGKFLLVKNREDLDLVRIGDGRVLQALPYKDGLSSFTGILLSADGGRVYTTNSRNAVDVARLDSDHVLHWESPITFPNPSVGGGPVPSGLALNGAMLYVTLNRSNTLAIVDLDHPARSVQVPVGVAPYSVVLASPSKAYVSNWGGSRPRKGEVTYPSSGTDVSVNPRTGVANSGTVSVVDLSRRTEVKSIPVGLHPCAMVLSPDGSRLYVACANSDEVAVIDTREDRLLDTISVHAQAGLPFGSAPNALAVSADGQYLYVANGTENAICVIRVSGAGATVTGFIPTGWYPGSVLADPTGKMLYVANVKGVGFRSMAADQPRGPRSHDALGTVSMIPVPGPEALDAFTRRVHENNDYARLMQNLHAGPAGRRKVPVPRLPGEVSVFRHVVYIIKENRTYDQVFGDIAEGDGDTSLVEFGKYVTPNEHLLAKTFVLMDNYNCSGVLSADGHQWTDEAYVTDYLEKAFGGFPRSYPFDGDDPLAYAPGGFIWDDVLSHGLTFRDYGEFVQARVSPASAKFIDICRDMQNGGSNIRITGKANVAQLEPYICPTFPGFTNRIPDVWRAAEFIKELKEFERKDSFPNFVIMELPDDHTAGTSPGAPTPRSAVADNDLALGQIVDALSHSPFWKETCIFVTEDDPQAGLDHVDGHRTVGLVISPYTRRGQVVSTYYSQINMVRTIENILGIPPMNQLDWTADAMRDCFTDRPDFTPYTAVPSNIPLDQMNLSLRELKGAPLYWAKKSLQQDLREADRINEDVFNRIIWHSVKGYDRAYPVWKAHQAEDSY